MLNVAAFVKRFGEYNAKTHTYAISSTLTSILNSFPYLGKLIVRPANPVVPN